MSKDFQEYVKLRRAIQDWLQGAGNLYPVADLLDVSGNSLRDFLLWLGVADSKGDPAESMETQDVFNCCFLALFSLLRRVKAKYSLIL
ncbi:hypothetical protein ES705_30416 [subsurface metagenome]